MNRRDFLGATLATFAAAPTAAARAPEITVTTTRIGPVDIDRHNQFRRGAVDLRVIHRATGEDLTNRCYFADDTGEGYALVFRHNAEGQPYIDRTTGAAARERVEGIRFRCDRV